MLKDERQLVDVERTKKKEYEIAQSKLHAPPHYAINDNMLAESISHLRHVPQNDVPESKESIPISIASMLVNEIAVQTEMKHVENQGLSHEKIEERKKNAEAIRRWIAKKIAENPEEFMRRQRNQKRDYRAYKKEQEQQP